MEETRRAMRLYLGNKIRKSISGEVIDNPDSLRAFSVDKSIYRVEPLLVCFPHDSDELGAILQTAGSEGVPVTPRGKGSGTAGACLGSGIVIGFSWTSTFSQVRDFSVGASGSAVDVGVGVVHNDLQRFLQDNGYFLPADPSSGAISVIGGNLGTKASGPHELSHGSIDRYLESVRFLTSHGEFIDTGRPETIPARIVDAITQLSGRITQDNQSVLALKKQRDTKCASGYQFGALVNHEPLPAIINDLMVGSIGTLGIITSATLSAELFVNQKASVLLFFDDLSTACRSVQCLRMSGATAIEITNAATLKIARKRHPNLPLPSSDAHMVFVEYEGDRCDTCAYDLEKILRAEGHEIIVPPVHLTGSGEEQRQLWKMRKEILPMLMGQSGDLIAPSLVNDVGVPVEQLADFIEEAEGVFSDLGVDAAIYGHAGSGNLHLRPLFRKTHPNLPVLLRETAERIYAAALSRGGTITAEHGMGRLRAPFLEAEWGSTIVGYMRKVKEIFDPLDIMNPGILFSNRDLLDEVDPVLLGTGEG